MINSPINYQDQILKLPKIAEKIKNGWVVSVYLYLDEGGNLIYAKVRSDSPEGNASRKEIISVSFNGSDWIFKEPSLKKGEKPLYNLHNLTNRANENEIVWIVEGEQCADALVALGFLATTSGAANSANAANWSVLAGKIVIIWPDNDEAGMRYAKEVTKILQGLDCMVQWMDVSKLGLAEKGDCVDWFMAHSDATKADIETLDFIDPVIESSVTDIGNNWPELIPLQRSLSASAKFPVHALGDVLRPLCDKITEIVQAPEAMCGNSLLAAVCLAVQGHADLFIDGRRYPLSEFFLTIGGSGERKTGVDSIVLSPHRQHQEDLIKKYRVDIGVYHRAKEAFDSSKKEILSAKAKNSYDQKQIALSRLGEPPRFPLTPMLLLEEPTYEGLVKLLDGGQPSIGLFSDEAGRFIGGHGMSDDNMLKTAAGLCKLWDASNITRVRAGDGASILIGRRLSVHLMAQHNIAELLLSNNALIEQGFLSRFLVACPESTAGSRPYNDKNIYEDPAFRRYSKIIDDIFRKELPLRAGTNNELAPREIKLSAAAKRFWISFHDEIESQIGINGHLESIKGLANKASEHAARLAGILALFEDMNCNQVSEQCMQSGIDLMRYYLSEALRLFERGSLDPELQLAEKLYAWLIQQSKAIISTVEIYQYGPNAVRDAAAARRIMNILCEHGYVKPTENVMYDGKIRQEGWMIRMPDVGSG